MKLLCNFSNFIRFTCKHSRVLFRERTCLANKNIHSTFSTWTRLLMHQTHIVKGQVTQKKSHVFLFLKKILRAHLDLTKGFYFARGIHFAAESPTFELTSISQMIQQTFLFIRNLKASSMQNSTSCVSDTCMQIMWHIWQAQNSCSGMTSFHLSNVEAV